MTAAAEPPNGQADVALVATNGLLIRIVGKHLRLRDSCLETAVWSIYCTLLLPYLIFKLVKGSRARPEQSFRQYLFQIFGWCGAPPSLPRAVNILHGNGENDAQLLRFVVISDTHNQHQRLELPDGDVLVHCGDFTNHGSMAEVKSFAEWFLRLPYRRKILVPGNHDMLMDKSYYESYWNDWSHSKEDSHLAFSLFQGVHVLIDEAVEVRGVKIYGSPHVPMYAPWKTAFNVRPDETCVHWTRIPDDVDVLLTHTPPAGILDRDVFGDSCGCPHLQVEVQQRIKPRFHVFGHVHSDWGARQGHDTCFVNAAMVSNFYSTAGRLPLCFSVPARREWEITS